MSLTNGIYNIGSVATRMYATFPDSQSNLSLFDVNTKAFQQQWDVQATGNGAYTIRNVQYNTYINIPAVGSSILQQTSNPYSFYIQLNGTGSNRYAISANNAFSLGFNSGSYSFRNTPVAMSASACCGGNDELWTFNLASNATSATNGTSERFWRKLAIAFISVVAAETLGLVLWFFIRWITG